MDRAQDELARAKCQHHRRPNRQHARRIQSGNPPSHEDHEKSAAADDDASEGLDGDVPLTRNEEGRNEVTIEPCLSRREREYDRRHTDEADNCFQAVPTHVDMVV